MTHKKMHVCTVILIAALLVLTAVTVLPRSAEAMTWGIPQTVDAGAQSGYASSLVLDASGNPHISYYVHPYLKYATKVNGNWISETVDNTDEDGNGLDVSLVLDASGNPHISYYSYVAQQEGLRHAWRDSTGTWHKEQVDSGYQVGHHSSLMIDGSGNPCISYSETFRTPQQPDVTVIKYAEKHGDTWVTTSLDAAGNAGNAGTSSIASKPGALAVGITYTDRRSSGEVVNYTSWYGSSWHTETIASGFSYGPRSLVILSDGTPGIVYGSPSPDYDLRYATKVNGNWVSETVDSVGSVGLASLDYRNGALGICYTEATSGILKYAWKDTDGWHTQTISSAQRYRGSLALDAGGLPRISYGDTGNSYQLKYTEGSRDSASLTITTSTTAPLINTPFTLSGTLKHSVTGIASQSVHLERRSLSGTTWSAWADVSGTTKTTDQYGKVSISQTVGTIGQYQYRWHFAGTATYQEARSSAVTETVKQPTTFTISSSTATPAATIPFTLYGTLTSGTTPLSGQEVHLEQRANVSGTWSAWADAGGSFTHTDSAGRASASQTVATAGQYQYRWHFNGTTTYKWARSSPLDETVRNSATSLVITASTTTPTVNTPFTLYGTLKSGTTALTSQPVHLERRSFSTATLTWGAWADVSGTTKTTDQYGKVSISQTIGATGIYQYRWHFGGTASYQEAHSAGLTETVKQPTTFSIASSTLTTATNKAFTLSGTLRSGTASLVYQEVHLERRAYASGAWGSWANVAGTYKYTTSTGTIQLSQTVATSGQYQYRWHYNGTTTYQQAYSSAVNETIKKPTTLTITNTTAAYNRAFTLSGTLKTGTTGLVGYSVHLEKKVGTEAWTDVIGSTRTTTTGGAIPAISQTMTVHTTYSYRWHFTGTGTYQAGYSPTKTFTV